MMGASVLAILAVGCADQFPTAGRDADSPAAPPAAPPIIGHYRVNVDMVAGKATVTSIDPTTGDADVAAMIYGGGGQMRFRFTVPEVNPIVDPEDPTKKLFTLLTRIENGRSHAIGTHVPRTTVAPSDTMGVFIYVSTLPQVIAGCTPSVTCTASVANFHGRGQFETPNQPYWYWPEILEANDGVSNSGGDLSQAQHAWVFRTDEEVTNFVFGVAVSAPWTPPNGDLESSWTVSYRTDSLPHEGSEPVWKRVSSGLVSNAIVSHENCPVSPCLQLSSTVNSGVAFFRSDSLGPGQSANITAEIRPAAAQNGNNPRIAIAMQDTERLIQFAFSGNRMGFANAEGTSFVAPHAALPAGPITVRVVKNVETQQAEAYVPWTALTPSVTVPLASLPEASTSAMPEGAYFWFISINQATSWYSSISYEIGSTGL